MVDRLKRTHLIDMKPFLSKFDNRTNTISGWLNDQGNIHIRELRSDERIN